MILNKEADRIILCSPLPKCQTQLLQNWSLYMYYFKILLEFKLTVTKKIPYGKHGFCSCFLSVCLSQLCPLYTIELKEGFWKNSPRMFTMFRRCAEPNKKFFKLYDCIWHLNFSHIFKHPDLSDHNLGWHRKGLSNHCSGARSSFTVLHASTSRESGGDWGISWHVSDVTILTWNTLYGGGCRR